MMLISTRHYFSSSPTMYVRIQWCCKNGLQEVVISVHFVKIKTNFFCKTS